MFHKILVPVDISETDVATPGIAAAVRLAKAFQSEIRLISVTIPPTVAAPMDFLPQSYFDDIDRQARATLATMAAKLDLPADRVSFTVRLGAVYPEVLAEAAAWAADLIVIGAHRPSMATYLLGSSAAAIVRHATCTVMVVRGDKPASFFGS